MKAKRFSRSFFCLLALATTVLFSVPASAGQFSALLQAEDMTLTEPTSVGTAVGASGGKYVHTPVGFDTRDPVMEGVLNFTVPAEGKYAVWARIFGPTDTADAIYLVVDNNSWQRRYPSKPGVWEWVKVGDYQLAAGEHQVKMGHGEILCRVDAFYVVDDTAAQPPYINLFEAEAMTLGGNFVVEADEAASGGQFIHATKGLSTREPEVEATLTINVPADGEYTLWVALYGPHGDADAMYVTIGDKIMTRLYPPSTQAYLWVRVGSYQLTAGEHVIKAGHGEIGCRIDAFYLTTAGDQP